MATASPAGQLRTFIPKQCPEAALVRTTWLSQSKSEVRPAGSEDRSSFERPSSQTRIELHQLIISGPEIRGLQRLRFGEPEHSRINLWPIMRLPFWSKSLARLPPASPTRGSSLTAWSARAVKFAGCSASDLMNAAQARSLLAAAPSSRPRRLSATRLVNSGFS
jgi:hypothetical protein